MNECFRYFFDIFRIYLNIEGEIIIIYLNLDFYNLILYNSEFHDFEYHENLENYNDLRDYKD